MTRRLTLASRVTDNRAVSLRFLKRNSVQGAHKRAKVRRICRQAVAESLASNQLAADDELALH
jgi:hypothetical protein